MFNHLADDRLRSILENNDTTADAVLYAFNLSVDAFNADCDDEDVSYTVLQTRELALEQADNASDPQDVITALKEFWS